MTILNVGYGTTNPRELLHLLQSNVTLRLQDDRNNNEGTTNIEFVQGPGDIGDNSYVDWKLTNSNSFFCIKRSADNITSNVITLLENGNVHISNDVVISGNFMIDDKDIVQDSSNYVKTINQLLTNRLDALSTGANNTDDELINTSNILYQKMFDFDFDTSNYIKTTNQDLTTKIDTDLDTTSNILYQKMFDFDFDTSNYIKTTNQDLTTKIDTDLDTTSNILYQKMYDFDFDTSNYIKTTDQDLTAKIDTDLDTTSNILYQKMYDFDVDTSNYIKVTEQDLTAKIDTDLDTTSNILYQKMYDFDFDTSNYIKVTEQDLTTKIDTDLDTTSNVLYQKMYDFDVDTSNYIKVTKNDLNDSIDDTNINLIITSNVISSRITNLNANQITDGSINKFIINGRYENDIEIFGDLTASNLIIHGTTATLNTDVYVTEQLDVQNNAVGVALNVVQNHATSDIANLSNNNEQVFTIKNDGKIGIGTNNPGGKLQIYSSSNLFQISDEQISINKSIIPDIDNSVDIGSATNKIRDVFISNNSLWIGDEHKLSISSDNKMTFRKRKLDTLPNFIYSISSQLSEAATNIAVINHVNSEFSESFTSVSELKLKHILSYARTFDVNYKISDIFTSDNNDYEQDNAADSWQNNDQSIYLGSSYNKIGIGTKSPLFTLEVTGVDGIKIPVGTTGERPENSAQGLIRYNTSTEQFEGFGAGNNWGSLGGVKDVNGDTYVSAENEAGEDNNELKFFTCNIPRMIISSNGLVGIGNTKPEYSIDVTGVDGIKIPVGTIGERPENSIQGLIRYNTTTEQFEGFGAGNNWGSLGGVKDVNGDTYVSAENEAGEDNNELKFFTCNIPRMIISSNGLVGIGTSIPSATLALYDTNTTLKIQDNSIDDTGRTGIELINGPNDSFEDNTNLYNWRMLNSNNQYILSSGSNNVIYDRFTISGDTGNVGLGTQPHIFVEGDSDEYKMTIKGSINVDGFIYKNGEIYRGEGSVGVIAQNMPVQIHSSTYTKTKIMSENISQNIVPDNGWRFIDNDLSQGFVIKIKPSHTRSKILINLSCHIGFDSIPESRWWGLKLYKLIEGGNWTEVTEANGSDDDNLGLSSCWLSHNLGANLTAYENFVTNVSGTFFDEPYKGISSVPKNVYYTVKWKSNLGTNDANTGGGELYLNRPAIILDTNNSPILSSTWSVQEVWQLGTPYIPGEASNTITIYNQDHVGIANTEPQYELDIGGDINISGKYYKDNIDLFESTSNYIKNTKQDLETKIDTDLDTTSNVLYQKMYDFDVDTSNYIKTTDQDLKTKIDTDLDTTSNILYQKMYDFDVDTSNYIKTTNQDLTTKIDTDLDTTSNILYQKMYDFDVDTSNYIKTTNQDLTTKINTDLDTTSNVLYQKMYDFDFDTSNYVKTSKQDLETKIDTDLDTTSNVLYQKMYDFDVDTSNYIKTTDQDLTTKIDTDLDTTSNVLYQKMYDFDVDTSNYIKTTDQDLKTKIDTDLDTTSNILYQKMYDFDVDTSNYIKVTEQDLSTKIDTDLDTTSNILYQKMYDFDVDTSNYIKTTNQDLTAKIDTDLDTTSNILYQKMYDFDVDTSNYIKTTDQDLSTKIDTDLDTTSNILYQKMYDFDFDTSNYIKVTEQDLTTKIDTDLDTTSNILYQKMYDFDVDTSNYIKVTEQDLTTKIDTDLDTTSNILYQKMYDFDFDTSNFVIRVDSELTDRVNSTDSSLITTNNNLVNLENTLEITSNLLKADIINLDDKIFDSNKIKDSIIPAASATSIGGIIVDNDTITIDSNGVISGSQNVDLSGYATKSYVDGIASGLVFKDAVKVATIGNITLSGTQILDDFSVAVGDRVLVKDQTTASENGIYLCATGAWTRTSDFDSQVATSDIKGAFIFVDEGDINGGSSFVCSNSEVTITIETTDITFSKFTSSGQLNANEGLIQDGNNISINPKTNGGIIFDDNKKAYIDLAASSMKDVLPPSKGGTGATSLDGLITLGTHTTGSYVGTITAGNGLATGATTIVDSQHTLSVNTKTQGGIAFEDGTLALDLSANTITGILSVSNGGTGANSLDGLIALGAHTTGTYVSTITAGGGLFTSGTNVATANHTLSIDAKTNGGIVVGDDDNKLALNLSASQITGTLSVANGGTGATSLNGLITLGSHTSGSYVATITAGAGLATSGTNAATAQHTLSIATKANGGIDFDNYDKLALNLSASQITGTLGVTNGGTGATTLDGLITLGSHTTGTYVSTITAAGGLKTSLVTSGLYGETAQHTLSIDAKTNGGIVVSDDDNKLALNLSASQITGTLSIANGGTGATSLNGLITLGSHTSGSYVATITAGAGLATSGTNEATAQHTLSIATKANGGIDFDNYDKLALNLSASQITGTLSVADGGTGATTLDGLIALGNHTTGTYVSTITAAGGLKTSLVTSGLYGETAQHTLSIDAKTNGGIVVGDDDNKLALNLSASQITGTLSVSNGGTGANSLNGLITLGSHTSGSYVATITAGAGLATSGTNEATAQHTLSIATKASGGIEFDDDSKLALNLGAGQITGTLSVVNGGTGATTLDGLIALGTHTTGTYVSAITAGGGLTTSLVTSGANQETSEHTISIEVKDDSGIIIDEDDKLALDLGASAITGILGVANGGTGSDTYSTDTIPIGNANKFIVNNTITPNSTISGDIIVAGNILPSANETFSLGSPDMKWDSLYVAANTINIGNTKLSSSDDGGLAMNIIKFDERINQVTSNELHSLSGVTGNVQQQINYLNLDNIADGATNRYIIDDTYNGSMYIASNFYVGKYFSTENPNGNLHVYGDMTIEGDINTINPLITQYHRHLSNYYTGFIELLNVDDTSNKPSIKIDHNVGYSNILEVSCKGDDGIFTISSNGFIGINRKDPSDTLDVDGNVIITGSINNITYDEFDKLSGINYNIKQRIDDNDANQSNYVDFTSNILFNKSYYYNQNISNFAFRVEDELNARIETTNGDIITTSNILFQKSSNFDFHVREYIDSVTSSITESINSINTIGDELTLTSNILFNKSKAFSDDSSNYISRIDVEHINAIDSVINNDLVETSNILFEKFIALDYDNSNFIIRVDGELNTKIDSIEGDIAITNGNLTTTNANIIVTSNILFQKSSNFNYHTNNFITSVDSEINERIDGVDAEIIATSNILFDQFSAINDDTCNFVIRVDGELNGRIDSVEDQIATTNDNLTATNDNIIATSNILFQKSSNFNYHTSNFVIRVDDEINERIDGVDTQIIATSNILFDQFSALNDDTCNFVIRIDGEFNDKIADVDTDIIATNNEIVNTSNILFDKFSNLNQDTCNFVIRVDGELNDRINSVEGEISTTNDNLNATNADIIVTSNILFQKSSNFTYHTSNFVIRIDDELNTRIDNVDNIVNISSYFKASHFESDEDAGIISIRKASGNNLGGIKVGQNTIISDTGTLSVDLSTYERGNVEIKGDLTTSNLTILGTSTTLETNVFTTERLEINNTGSGTAISVTQTGISNDIFTASNGSGEVFSIINNGNVGIGITNPSVSLQVIGEDGIVVPVGTQQQRPGNITGLIRYNTTTSSFEGYGSAWGSLGGVKDVAGHTYITAEDYANAANNELKFVTSQDQRMIIDSQGRVGIGITNPQHPLDISGSINISSGSKIKINGVNLQQSDIEGTLSLSAGGTGASSAVDARANLGLTDLLNNNTTDVTLASVENNYLTINGQDITAGTIPISKGGTGATSVTAARTALGVDEAGTDNSTNVTLADVAENYLSINITNQVITAGQVPISLGGTGASTLSGARTALGISDVSLTDVTNNYLSVSGNTITAGVVPLSLGGTGATDQASAALAILPQNPTTDSFLKYDGSAWISTIADIPDISGITDENGNLDYTAIKVPTTTTIVDTTISDEPEVITENLIVHYKFDGDLTNSVSGSSIGSLLTTNSAATFIDTPGNYILGKSALVNNTALTIPNFHFGSLTEGSTKSFTISFWFKANSISGTWNVLIDASRYSTSTDRRGFRVYIKSDNQLVLVTYNTTATSDYILSLDGNFTDSNWRLFTFAFEYNSNTSDVYSYNISFYENNLINGSVITRNIKYVNTDGVHIGDGNPDGVYPMEGYYDDFRIYNKALSAVEISNLYNQHTLIVPYSLYTDTTYKLQSSAEFNTGVKGWRIVRFRPNSLSSNWYSYNDNAIGTHSNDGVAYDYTNQWTILFGDFDELLFSTYNMQHWLRATKSEVQLSGYSDVSRIVLSSSRIFTQHTVKWYNRTGVNEDPFISLYDHNDYASQGLSHMHCLYSDGNSIHHRQLLEDSSLGGMCVFVRSSTNSDSANPAPEYKYLTFEYKPSYSTLSIDFEPYNTQSTWTNYINSLQTDGLVQSYYLNYILSTGYTGSVFQSTSTIGYIDFVIPQGYNACDITYGRAANDDPAQLKINNIDVDSTNDNLKTYKATNLVSGQIIRIYEVHGQINRVIKLFYYNAHTEYNVNFPEETTCDILIIGGGGAGGSGIGGGGGAGGVVYIQGYTMNENYKIKVGNGGINTGIAYNTQDVTGANGHDSGIYNMDNSSINYNQNGGNFNLVGIGGGGGGAYDGSSVLYEPDSGGSSGGVGVGNLNQTYVNSKSALQGNTYWNGTTFIPGGYVGGNGFNNSGLYTGGGGGAGGAGSNGVTNKAGDGGSGIINNITGNDMGYAGGGGGSTDLSTANTEGVGGYVTIDNEIIYLGGNGIPYGTADNQPGGDGLSHTGSGGGGGGWSNSAELPGNGGSGIVIIRYSMGTTSTASVSTQGYLTYDSTDGWYVKHDSDLSTSNLTTSNILTADGASNALEITNNTILTAVDIIPSVDNAVDLGSVDNKFRDVFISNNSLWIGDTHKLAISDNKMKFRKRKTETLPQTLYILSGLLSETATNTAAINHANDTFSETFSTISELKLKHILSYARTLNSSYKISDLFADNITDYEEENAADAWQIHDTSLLLGSSYQRVGIGVANPTSNLDVAGDINFTGNLTQNGVAFSSYTDSDVQALLATSAGTGLSWNAAQSKFDASQYTDSDVQSVLATSAGTGLSWNIDTSQFDASQYADSDVVNVLSSKGGSGIVWNSTTSKFDIDSNVTIANDLTINGDLKIIGNFSNIETAVQVTDQFKITNNDTGPALIVNQTGSHPIVKIQDDSTDVFTIVNGGKVGIGVASPTEKIDVNGFINVASGYKVGGNNINFSHISGTLGIAAGGTGATDQASAALAILPQNPTTDSFLKYDGSAWIATIADIPDISGITDENGNLDYTAIKVPTTTTIVDTTISDEPEVISGNLVAWYKFDNNLIDSTGNTTLEPILSTYTDTHVEGIINEGIDLEDATYKTNSDLLASTFDSDIFSIAFWLKNDDLNSRSVIITRYDNNEIPRCGFSSMVNNTGKIKFQRLVYGNIWKILETNIIINLNTWYHVVFKCEPYKLQIYVNGILDNELTFTQTYNAPAYGNLIGFGRFAVSAQFTNTEISHNYLDDFRIYDKALSAAEITNLYNDNTLIVPYSLYTDTTQSLQSLAEFKTGLVGWQIVANLKVESSRTMNWFTDGFLNGNITSGDPNDFTNDWEKPFTNKDQILFVKGDFERWAYCSYTDLIALSGNSAWHQLDATTSQYKADGSAVTKIAVLTEYGGSHSPFILLGKSYDATNTGGVDFNGGEEWLYLEEGIVVNAEWNKWLNTPYYIFVRSSTDIATTNPAPEYKTLTFTHDGSANNQTEYTITFPEETTCDILLVGGGGSGGCGSGTSTGSGGGGGGEVKLLQSFQATSNTSYIIKIGKGGDGKLNQSYPSGTGNIGNNSSFDTYTALGGGGGGIRNIPANSSSTYTGGGGGGYGGGGNTGAIGYNGGNGGNGSDTYYGAGGGGGAGGVGQNGSGDNGGDGGVGLDRVGSFIFAEKFGTQYGYLENGTTWFGGGGGGSGEIEIGANGSGKHGGTIANNTNGISQNALWGGGSGGAVGTADTDIDGDGSLDITSGNGGSGIVIIRYSMGTTTTASVSTQGYLTYDSTDGWYVKNDSDLSTSNLTTSNILTADGASNALEITNNTILTAVDIIPSVDNAVDLGSVDNKFRDVFISNNSLWIGDTHKLAISTDNKMTFRKRKTSSVPAAIITAGGDESGAIDFTGHSSISDFKLKDWLNYMKSLPNAPARPKISDIFRETEEDYEEENAADAWQIHDTSLLLGSSYTKVGIGVANPTSNLDVAGDINFTGNLTQNGVAFSSYTDSDVQAVLATSAGTGLSWNTDTSQFDASQYTDSDVQAVLATSAGTGLSWNIDTSQFDASQYTDSDVQAVLATSAGTGLSWNTDTSQFDASQYTDADARTACFPLTQTNTGLSGSSAINLFDNGLWYNSVDGQNRMQFTADGTTYIRTPLIDGNSISLQHGTSDRFKTGHTFNTSAVDLQIGTGANTTPTLSLFGANSQALSSRIIFADSGTTTYKFGMSIYYDSLNNKLKFSGDENNDNIIDSPPAITIVRSNRYVGISNHSPTVALDVAGSINFTGNLTQNGQPFGSYTDTDTRGVLSTSGGSGIVWNSTTSKFDIDSNVTIANDLTINGDLKIIGNFYNVDTEVQVTDQLSITNTGSGPALIVNQTGLSQPIVKFQDDGTDVFTIVDGGNVGIGVASPTEKIDVNGFINAASGYKVAGNNIAFTDITGTLAIDSGGTGAVTQAGAANNILPSVTTGHYLKFDGTNWVGSAVEASGGGGSSLWSEITNTSVGSIFYDSNVKIGGDIAVEPAAALEINGNLVVTGTIISGWNGDIDSELTTSGGGKWSLIGDTDDLYYSSNVKIGGNEEVTPVAKLEVNGDIVATGDITAGYSDDRLKDYISNITNPIDIIKSLNGYYFKPNELANSFGYTNQEKEIGVSAQEVKSVLPEIVKLAPFDSMCTIDNELVSKSGSNYLTVNYEKMAPLFIEAIKKLSDKIDNMTIELNSLKEFKESMSNK